MLNDDILTDPILFALHETMKRFENSDDENDKIIFEGLRRSKAVWENIRINGLEIYNLTYEQFCNQFSKKKNIMFMTDDEIEDYNKAVDIMNIMRK